MIDSKSNGLVCQYKGHRNIVFGTLISRPRPLCPPAYVHQLLQPCDNRSGWLSVKIGWTNCYRVRGIKRTPSGSKSKHVSPCEIHACELDPFLVATIKMAGVYGRPYAYQLQVATVPQARISPPEPNQASTA